MRLPPLNSLRAFEAAARHGNYAQAAEELFVTRGAISRHVKLLEEHLGVELFRRLPQGLELTVAGHRYLPVLSETFGRIAAETARLTREREDLRIICPPTMSIRWLIPGLAEFQALHPDFGVRLTTGFFLADGLDTDEFDLGFSVESVPNRAPDIAVLPLLPLLLSPACSPRLLNGEVPLRKPEDLARFTLLHEGPERDDWNTWLAAFGIDGVDPMSGNVLPNLDMALKAAVMGAGIVMGDLVLARDELDSGTLVLPFPDLKCETAMGRFCLIGAPARWTSPKVEAFKAWALDKARRDTAELALS
ncbi:MAG: LysR family transcriptional regulator [Oricola sp.]|nr:LysR family transcriptional regulator [Oricola sp.]